MYPFFCPLVYVFGPLKTLPRSSKSCYCVTFRVLVDLLSTFLLYTPHCHMILSKQKCSLWSTGVSTRSQNLTSVLHLRSKIEKVPREGYSKSIVRKNNDKFGKGLVSTSRTYASPKGTGPGVRRSKRPLSACHTRRKCSIETTPNSVKGRGRYKV